MADHRHLDLPWVGHFLPNPLGNLKGKRLGRIVAHASGIHHYSDFPSGVDRIGIFDAVERLSDLLQISNPFDIPFGIVATGAGT